MLGINRAYAKNSLSKNLVKMVSVKVNLFASNIKINSIDINLKMIFPLPSLFLFSCQKLWML